MTQVCVISRSGELGGSDRSMLDTIAELRKRGFRCQVILPARGELCARLEAEEVPYAVIEFRPWLTGWMPRAERVRRLLREFPCAAQMARQIRWWNPDVIYTNTVCHATGALAARLAGKRHVWHLREFGQEDHGLHFVLGERWTPRVMARLADAFVANSEAVKTKFARHIPASRIHVVHQGVGVPRDSGASYPKPAGRFRCVAAGAIHEGKRQEDAIRAVGQLVREGLDVELLIVGDPGSQGYLRALRRMAGESGAGDRIRFLGHSEDVFAILRQSDAALMCSRCEAFGRVTVEGMLAGKPVIGARSGGTPEIVRDETDGLLYEPCNPPDLARKIRFLCEHPEAAARMGASGRERAQSEFSLERYGDRMAAILQSPGR